MTREDKELLLKDLSARLTYGVIIQEYNEEYGYTDNVLNTISMGYFSIHEACIEGTWINRIENVRPYLRLMSSMTEEEEFILDETRCWTQLTLESYDWLLKHHFDFRGLIEKGLAIEVTEENNPYKE